MTLAIAVLAFMFAGQAAQPELTFAKPTLTLTDSDHKDVAACDLDSATGKVSNCVVADGRTVTEAIQVMYTAFQRVQTDYDNRIRGVADALRAAPSVSKRKAKRR